MGKSKTVKTARKSRTGNSTQVTSVMMNKILGAIVSKASKPGPKLSLYQKAYVNECSCFLISSLMELYPAFAAKMNPRKLEQLLGKFLRSCKQTRSKMTGGTLALKKHRRTMSGGSLFLGVFMLLYAMFVTRASIEQMNQQNPFRKSEYTMLNLAKEETLTFQITRDNLMRWLKEPSVILAEATNTLLMKAVKIVGKVTNEYTEGLEQAVSDHCMGESSGEVPELRNRILEVPEQEFRAPAPQPAPEPMPEEPSRWSTFTSRSWSAFSGAASTADQAMDRLAKVHLAAVNLFDMPGCIQRVHDIKYQEFLDKLKSEHARLKLDIHNWGKKGQNDVHLIFTLFQSAIGFILGAFGISATRLMNRNTQNEIMGEAYNMNKENSTEQLLLRHPSRPLSGPALVMPPLAQDQPYLQSFGPQALVQPLQAFGQLPQIGYEDERAERERRAMLAVQANMNRLIRPAMNAVERQHQDRRAHMQRSIAASEHHQAMEAEQARQLEQERRMYMRKTIEASQQQQAMAAEQARQRQEEIAHIKRVADEIAAGMRKRR